MDSFYIGNMPLGAPPWLFFTLLFAIFWLHLMSMWFLIGSLIWGVIAINKDKNNWQKEKVLAYLPVIFALVINLGVPPLLFVQILYAPFFFSSSILLSVPWISVFFLLMLAYGLVYAAKYGAKHAWQAITFLSVSTIAVLLISFIYSNNMSLMIKPEYWQQLYSVKQNGLNLYPNLPEVIARWSWVLAPCLIAGSVLLNKFRKPAILLSCLIGLAGLIIYQSFWNPVVSSYTLVQISLMADLGLSSILGILSLIKFSEAQESLSKIILYAWIALKGIAVVALRHGIRAASLNSVYDLDKVPVNLQPVLASLFIGATLISLGTITWMYRKGRKGLTI